MLSRVEIINPLGQTLSIPIGHTVQGFFISDILGLDPEDAQIVTSSFANLDGTRFQSARLSERNLVFTLGFDPNFTTTTPDTARQQLYRWFFPRKQIRMRFVFLDGKTYRATGMVETFDSPRFAKELKATVSVLCFDPYFYDETETVISGNSTSTGSYTNVTYAGSEDTGFTIEIDVNRNISGLQINTRRNSSDKQALEFMTPMTSADKVFITTVPGRKSAVINRLGINLPMLAAVAPQSDWPQLRQGTNQVWVAISGAAIPYTLKFTNRYGGI